MLVAIGAVAAGPPVPEVDIADPELATMMSSATQEKFVELTYGGQRIINDVWPQVKDQAPREYWEAEVQRIVEVVTSHEAEHGLQDVLVPIAATPWTSLVKDTDIHPGYSSSITGVYETNEALGVTVAVGVHGANNNMCTSCTVVYAGVSAPPNQPGQYTASGSHTAANPQGFGTSHAYLEIAP